MGGTLFGAERAALISMGVTDKDGLVPEDANEVEHFGSQLGNLKEPLSWRQTHCRYPERCCREVPSHKRQVLRSGSARLPWQRVAAPRGGAGDNASGGVADGGALR